MPQQGLLLVDLQNDYFPAGRMELVGSEAAVEQAAAVLAHFRAAQKPVIHIQHIAARPGATFFLPNTPGAEIHPRVAPQPGEPVIQKHYPNSFRETSLLETLKSAGVEELVICGAMSHMCVDAATRAATDLGFRCTLLTDACATRDLTFGSRTVAAADVHAAFMAALASYARLSTAGEYLAEQSKLD